MSVANQLYGVKNAANVCLFGAESGELAVDLDYANSLELDLKEDGIQYAMRDGSKKAIKFDGEVVGTLKIGVDMVNSDLLAFINRSKLLKGLRDIFKNETVKVTEDDQVCTFENEVKGILGVYKVKKDGTKISKLSDASCAGKNVTLTGAKAGDIVKVYYTSEKEVTTFKIKGTKEVQEDYIGYADVLGKA